MPAHNTDIPGRQTTHRRVSDPHIRPEVTLTHQPHRLVLCPPKHTDSYTLYEAFAEQRTCASGRTPRIHPSYRTSKSAEQLQVPLTSSTHTKCFVVSHERNLAHHGSVLRPCRPLFFAPPGGRGERRAHPSCVPSHQRPSRQMRGAHAPSFLHAATSVDATQRGISGPASSCLPALLVHALEPSIVGHRRVRAHALLHMRPSQPLPHTSAVPIGSAFRPPLSRDQSLMLARAFLTLLPWPRKALSSDSTPIASFACMSRLPIAAGATVSRASTSTNSL